MIEFIRESGAPIWPVLLLGATALASAVQYAWTLQRRLLPLAGGATLATLFMGTLGTVVGIQYSVGGLHLVAPDQRWIFLIGLKESLNNLVAALVIALLVALVLTAGAYRSQRARELALEPAGAAS